MEFWKENVEKWLLCSQKCVLHEKFEEIFFFGRVRRDYYALLAVITYSHACSNFCWH